MYSYFEEMPLDMCHIDVLAAQNARLGSKGSHLHLQHTDQATKGFKYNNIKIKNLLP